MPTVSSVPAMAANRGYRDNAAAGDLGRLAAAAGHYAAVRITYKYSRSRRPWPAYMFRP